MHPYSLPLKGSRGIQRRQNPGHSAQPHSFLVDPASKAPYDAENLPVGLRLRNPTPLKWSQQRPYSQWSQERTVPVHSRPAAMVGFPGTTSPCSVPQPPCTIVPRASKKCIWHDVFINETEMLRIWHRSARSDSPSLLSPLGFSGSDGMRRARICLN